MKNENEKLIHILERSLLLVKNAPKRATSEYFLEQSELLIPEINKMLADLETGRSEILKKDKKKPASDTLRGWRVNEDFWKKV